VSDEHVIADTNVISYLMKNAELGRRFKPHLAGKIVGIAFVTVAEMRYGAERAGEASTALTIRYSTQTSN
jgi:predicted nucleic acid-binding protein